jgi:hypothetical protein
MCQSVVGWWAHGQFTDILFLTYKYAIFFNVCLIVYQRVVIVKVNNLSKDI